MSTTQYAFARLRNRKKVATIGDELSSRANRPFTGTIEYIEHHLARLASAFRDEVTIPVDEVRCLWIRRASFMM
jgi:predicted NodU family carbamoyl transferase